MKHVKTEVAGDIKEPSCLKKQVRAQEVLSLIHIFKAYANVAEQRLDDSDCTLESLLHDNARALELCRKYGVPYTWIEHDYRIDI